MRFATTLIVSAVVCGLACQSASAGPFGRQGGVGIRLEAPYLGPDREIRETEGPRRLSPGEAAQKAQAINGGGRVLAVEPTSEGYRVKLLRDGEVRVIYVH